MKVVDAVEALGALAQESRLSVFRLLVKQGPSGLPAGAISEKLGIPAPTLSFHLSQLNHAGLVKSRRESRSIIYSADYETIKGLINFLMENCCQGTDKDKR
jgi:ArsR family transcriptional regulator